MSRERESAGQPDTARPTIAGAGVVVRVSLDGSVSLTGDDPLLTVAQCAARVGVTPGTWRSFVSDGYVPAADDPGDTASPVNRRTPKWRASTVDTFVANRPGRGRGPRPNARKSIMRGDRP